MKAAEVRTVAEPPVAPGNARSGLSARLRAWFELSKPGITRMIVIATAAAFYMGSGDSLDFILLVHTIIGTTLASSGANAMNQWAERNADARMRRTKRRPIPSGRLSSREGFLVSAGMAVAGVAYLQIFVNSMAALLVALSFASYIFVYTPLKRRSWTATVVGAFPGALPALAGWCAAGQPINVAGLTIFGILFLWQMPHFYALAWMFRDDYRDGGFKLLTVIDNTGRRAARQSLLYTAVLLPVSLLPTLLGLTGGLYFAGALLLSTAFLLASGRFFRRPQDGARPLFLGSIAYLPLLYLLLVIDKTAL